MEDSGLFLPLKHIMSSAICHLGRNINPLETSSHLWEDSNTHNLLILFLLHNFSKPWLIFFHETLIFWATHNFSFISRLATITLWKLQNNTYGFLYLCLGYYITDETCTCWELSTVAHPVTSKSPIFCCRNNYFTPHSLWQKVSTVRLWTFHCFFFLFSFAYYEIIYQSYLIKCQSLYSVLFHLSYILPFLIID